ncbi:MAG: hypothetical protein ACE5FU_10095, partial [Nitrospinota bacterium]
MKEKQGSSVRSSADRLLFIFPAVLSFFVFSGLLRAHFITIDDPLLFGYLPNLELKNIFSVEGNAPWFRPFLDISFLIDYKIWLFDPFGYHLTNLLLHSVNTVLVACLSLTLFEGDRKTAFLGSLLFSLNPVNLEAVAWISARADLLSTATVLTALILIFHYIKSTKHNFLPLIFSMIAYSASLLVKESAMVFILVVLAYSLFHPFAPTRPKALRVLPPLFVFSVITLFYFLLRGNSISGEDQSKMIPELYFLHVVAPFFDDPDFMTAFFHALLPVLNFLGALGFYIKKIFLPYPLNMMILSISEDFYILFLIALLAFVFIFFRKSRTPLFLFLSFFLFLMRAFPIAFTNIAWTHYSERYLYLPGIFVLIGAAAAINLLIKRFPQRKRYITVLLFLILLQFAFTDIFHGKIWQNSISVTEHLLDRNPHIAEPYEVLGVFHYSEGRVIEAREMFEKAIERGAQFIPYFYIGLMALQNGEEEKAIANFKKSNMDYLKKLGDYYLDKSTENALSKPDFLKKAKKYYEASYKDKKEDPSLLYRLAMVHFKLGDFKKARKFTGEISQ